MCLTTLTMRPSIAPLLQELVGVKNESSNDKSAQAVAVGLRRVLIRDAFNYFLSKIVPGLSGFLSVLVFVRVMGVEQYGRFSVVFAFVVALASGLAAWLGQGVLRLHSQSRNPGKAADFLRSVKAGTALSAAAGSVLISLTMPAFGVQKGWPLLISLLLLVVLIVYSVAISRFQASL